MNNEETLFYKIVDWKRRLERERDFFKELIIQNKYSHILDLGCGVGEHLIEFSPWFKKGWGLDFSETSIKIAKKKVKKSGLKDKIDFICKDMRNLPTLEENMKFDLIYCIGNSFALFPKHERECILKESFQRLNPGGSIILQVVNYLKKSKVSEWLINPKVFRNEEGLLSFYVRISDWKMIKKKNF
ncbi:MAG: class I SAM-dependent methyltransferase [Candidatus Heimdallarchaeaceae archaeon]